MLFSSGSTLAVRASELRSVRRSLNTPVMAIAELPIGPATAAIATHADSDGGAIHWTVAVRCERTRDVVYFSAREPSGESRLLAEAALSLAEGMGFLFEDQVLEGSESADPGEAHRVWEEFLGPDRTAGAAEDGSMAPRAPSHGVALTKFRFALNRVGLPAAAAPTAAAGPVPSPRRSRPARRKRSWRGFLWRSTE